MPHYNYRPEGSIGQCISAYFLPGSLMAVTDHLQRLSDEIAVHACGAGGVTSFATLIFFATMSLSPIPMRPITM